MKQNGQALILIIIASAVALTILTSAILAAVGQARSSLTTRSGQNVYFAAESAADQSIIKLIRTPTFTPYTSCPASENYTQDSININVNYGVFFGVCVVTSQAQKDTVIKKIQSLAGNDASSRVFNICCWKEIP